MRNAGLEEAQAGIKIAGRNISNLRYADDTTLTQLPLQPRCGSSPHVSFISCDSPDSLEATQWAPRDLRHDLRGEWHPLLVLFTFCHKGGVICISEVTDISPSNLDSSLDREAWQATAHVIAESDTTEHTPPPPHKICNEVKTP